MNKSQAHEVSVAVIPGDGIGPEVVAAALPAIDAVARTSGVQVKWNELPYGADHYLATGETLPDSAFEDIRDTADAVLLGALGDPRVPSNEHARDILLGLRFRLDLYINFRPCVLLHPDLCPLKSKPATAVRNIDFAIFRENTEGLYLGRGSTKNEGSPDEECIAEEVHTYPKVSRIIRAAFEWAAANGKSRITMADKSNAIPAHRLWCHLFEKIGDDYPEIEGEHWYVDALAMEMVREPERFQVIVTNNLLGDILSDLGAQLVGGLGMAASANLHPGRPGLFEPVHGSAPPLAGTRTANPMAALRTGALLMADLGYEDAARALDSAVRAALAAGVTTPDLGGQASTLDVAGWVTDYLAAN
ncbi:MAG: isocitrate/isopropylmalate dehydrogenase family protein [Gemmatimonadales bacterium]